MAFDSSSAASGAASGAAAGTAIMPGWGTAIGAVAGGLLGGFGGGSGQSAPQSYNIGNPYTQGSVSGIMGGVYQDPITGRLVYAYNQPSGFTADSYRNALMKDALLGGNTANTQLDQQIAQLQSQIKQASGSSGVRKLSPSDYGDLVNWIDPKTGKLIEPGAYVNKRGSDVPNGLWETFMKQTGGNFGSKNADISFNKWLKYNEEHGIGEDFKKYQDDLKKTEGNQSVNESYLTNLNQQLNALQGLKGQGAAGAGVAGNPMLDYLNNGADVRAANAALSQNAGNQYKAMEQNLAKRGISGSSMADLSRANFATQNALAQQAQTTNLQNQNYQNRMAMLNYLSGQTAQDTGLDLSRQNAYTSQMGQGMGVTGNYASGQYNASLANIANKNANALAQFNQSQIDAQRQQQNINSAIGTLGSMDWGSLMTPKEGSVSTNQGYGAGNANTLESIPSTDRFDFTGYNAPNSAKSYISSTQPAGGTMGLFGRYTGTDLTPRYGNASPWVSTGSTTPKTDLNSLWMNK